MKVSSTIFLRKQLRAECWGPLEGGVAERSAADSGKRIRNSPPTGLDYLRDPSDQGPARTIANCHSQVGKVR